MQDKELSILILEDTDSDAELIVRELKTGGLRFQIQRAWTEEKFLELLEKGSFDLILSDYSMPQFNALEALRLLKATSRQIPFILVTGSQGEEVAIRCIHEGIQDYILKSSLIRLPSAVLNVLAKKRAEEKRLIAEEELKRSEEKYRNLFEESKDFIFFTDVDGRFLDVNRTGEELLGYSREELRQLNFRDICVNASERDEFRRVMGIQGFVKDFEVVLRARDESTLTFIESSSEVRDKNGRLTGYNGILHDITQLKRLQSQLVQAQKIETIGRLAGGIAHDFNNILMAISGLSELLLVRLPQSDPNRKHVESILGATRQGSSLTQQLLAFSRKQVLQPRLLNLNDLLLNLENMAGRLLGEDIELVFELEKNLGPVKADPTQIEQVILNLIINARDAMLSGGKLTIQTENAKIDDLYASQHIGAVPGKYVLISISDTGIGMDDVTRTKIFEPFFTTKEHGTGLGLASAYGTIKQSGGYITVYSESGMGTTFKIFLPRVEITETFHVSKSEAMPSIPMGTETILLVDDNEAVRSAMSALLEAFGYKVLNASSGPEAIRISGKYEGPIHLLISDLVMPQMRGQELGTIFRNTFPESKVLLMSGYSEEVVRRQGSLKEAGFTFLQKPATKENLLTTIRKLLDS